MQQPGQRLQGQRLQGRTPPAPRVLQPVQRTDWQILAKVPEVATKGQKPELHRYVDHRRIAPGWVVLPEPEPVLRLSVWKVYRKGFADLRSGFPEPEPE